MKKSLIALVLAISLIAPSVSFAQSENKLSDMTIAFFNSRIEILIQQIKQIQEEINNLREQANLVQFDELGNEIVQEGIPNSSPAIFLVPATPINETGSSTTSITNTQRAWCNVENDELRCDKKLIRIPY